MEHNGWEVLDVLKTAKVGRELWMTLTATRFRTPNGIDIVPPGRLFDHASVPRLFANAVPPVKSCIAEPSLWHDEQYCKDTAFIERKLADIGLRELTISKSKSADGVDDEIAQLAYTAVRIGASKFYDKQYNYEKIVDVYLEFKGMTLAELQEKVMGYSTLEARLHNQDCVELWAGIDKSMKGEEHE